MNAVITDNSHVLRALDFYNSPGLYFGIGGYLPWEDEEQPPLPSSTTEAIDGLIGFKKVEIKYLVVPDSVNGTLIYRDSKWAIVEEVSALTLKSRWVYVSSYLLYDELPLTTYRQIGVFSRALPVEGVIKDNLLPEEMFYNGVLEVLDYRTPQPRQLDQKEQLSIILEF